MSLVDVIARRLWQKFSLRSMWPLCLVVLAWGPNLVLARGTESAGGGEVVGKGDQLVLADFLEVDTGFRETHSCPPGVCPDAHASAERILEAWTDLRFDLSGIRILHSLRSIQWQFVSEDLRLQSGGPLLAGLYESLGTVAKVKLQQGFWPRMGPQSQVGLIMHEALRDVQIRQEERFDELSLKRATSILVLCQPTSRLTYYLFFLIRARPDLAELTYGPFDQVMSRDCLRTLSHVP